MNKEAEEKFIEIYTHLKQTINAFRRIPRGFYELDTATQLRMASRLANILQREAAKLDAWGRVTEKDYHRGIEDEIDEIMKLGETKLNE